MKFLLFIDSHFASFCNTTCYQISNNFFRQGQTFSKKDTVTNGYFEFWLLTAYFFLRPFTMWQNYQLSKISNVTIFGNFSKFTRVCSALKEQLFEAMLAWNKIFSKDWVRTKEVQFNVRFSTARIEPIVRL